MVLEPKFTVGIATGGLSAIAGLNDVRDGLSVQSITVVSKQYATEGHTIGEALSNVKAVDPDSVLDEVLLATSILMREVIHETGIEERSVSKVEAVVSIYVGVGVSAGIFLGARSAKQTPNVAHAFRHPI